MVKKVDLNYSSCVEKVSKGAFLFSFSRVFTGYSFEFEINYAFDKIRFLREHFYLHFFWRFTRCLLFAFDITKR